jgi:hypothetical protein
VRLQFLARIIDCIGVAMTKCSGTAAIVNPHLLRKIFVLQFSPEVVERSSRKSSNQPRHSRFECLPTLDGGSRIGAGRPLSRRYAVTGLNRPVHSGERPLSESRAIWGRSPLPAGLLIWDEDVRPLSLGHGLTARCSPRLSAISRAEAAARREASR